MLELNIKFAGIEFKATLPKHHEGIGAVERIIGVIKNTASKAVIGPNQLQMDDKEIHTWLSMVTEKVNDRPLILGAPQGITITPNHVLQGFRNTHGEEVNLDVPVDPGVHQTSIQRRLEKSIHRSQGGRHCAVQEQTNLQARPLRCQGHSSSPEDEWRHLRCSNSIQKRGRRKINVCQQTSPHSLSFHGRRVHCSPGGHHNFSGRRRSRNYHSRTQSSSSGNSGRVLQHRVIKLHISWSVEVKALQKCQNIFKFKFFRNFF